MIGHCEACGRDGVRVHHIRRFGDLTSGRYVCVDEPACFAAFRAPDHAETDRGQG